MLSEALIYIRQQQKSPTFTSVNQAKREAQNELHWNVSVGELLEYGR